MEFKETKITVLLQDGSVDYLVFSHPFTEVPSVPSIRDVCLRANLSRRFSTPVEYFIYNCFWFDLSL